MQAQEYLNKLIGSLMSHPKFKDYAFRKELELFIFGSVIHSEQEIENIIKEIEDEQGK